MAELRHGTGGVSTSSVIKLLTLVVPWGNGCDIGDLSAFSAYI